MAIQTFTVGQILTAAQQNALQANDYNQTVSAKVASYTLVAADKGTRITMSNAAATTITVNTSLFAAGDSLRIQNIGAGACTVTAGTATVTSAGPLAIPQWGGGQLFFTSASAAVYFPDAANATPRIGQVVTFTSATMVSTTSTSYVTTSLTASITPTVNTSKIMIIAGVANGQNASLGSTYTIFRGTVAGTNLATDAASGWGRSYSPAGVMDSTYTLTYLDSPATTSATTYTIGFKTSNATSYAMGNTGMGVLTLMEVLV